MSLKVVGYCRLSRDDDRDGESSSITSQKLIIENYCASNGLEISSFFIDDGVSGTTFNRPQFMKMIEEIDNGNVNCVITKDLSRLGRDYIMAGYYTEIYFPENNVRYIAINDSFDSNKSTSNNDFAPIKNVFNDMYAKDISKKIRASMYVKALNGEHFSAYAVMGYKKSEIENNKLVIDEEIAPVIRAIFSMYLEGYGCQEIRNHLQRNKVRNPSAWAHYKGYIDNSRYGYEEDESKQYKWSNEMVSRILKNETYIGSTVHYRSRKANHKSKQKKQSKDKHLVIENTHEPIIRKADFERVQKGLGLHKKPVNKRENVFIGVVKCADCGASMKLGQSTRVRLRDGVEVTRKHLSCANNNKYGRAVCTCHYTDYYELVDLTRYVMNETIKMVQMNEGELMKNIAKLVNEESENKNKALKEQLKKLEKREKELDNIFIKLYEDRALGKIEDTNYNLLSEKFSKEKEEVSANIFELSEVLKAESEATDNAKNFIDLVKDMQEITELNEDILNTLVDKIVVYNAEGKGKNKKQKIDIHFKFIGNVNLENGGEHEEEK